MDLYIKTNTDSWAACRNEQAGAGNHDLEIPSSSYLTMRERAEI
jgi:hypothetical protein